MNNISNKLSVRNVTGANNLFRVVYMNDENESWTVVDCFGNIVTPFLKGFSSVVPYSSTNCVVCGTDLKGKKKAFDISCSETDPNKYTCKKLQFPYPVHYASYIDKETLIFGTDQGLCFVDSRNFKQKSDFYDTLYFNRDPKVNRWVYRKSIANDQLSTTLTGTISLNGQIGEKAYDTFFHKVRDVESSKVSEYRYDVIEEASIIQELDDRVRDDNIRAFNGLKRTLINK